MAKKTNQLLRIAIRKKETDGYMVVEHQHDQGAKNLPIQRREIADASAKVLKENKGEKKRFVFIVAHYSNRRRRRQDNSKYVPLNNRRQSPGRKQWRIGNSLILLPTRMQHFITKTKERLEKYKNIFRRNNNWRS